MSDWARFCMRKEPNNRQVLAHDVPGSDRGRHVSSAQTKRLPEHKNNPDAGSDLERPPDRFLSVRHVSIRYGCSVATVWRWTRAGPPFPKPIKLSASCTRWRETDLLAFEASLGEKDA